MDEKQLARTLEQEGFRHTYVWQDAPNASYPDHTYAAETAHIILSGEMTLTWTGRATRIALANAATFRQALCTPRAWVQPAAAI
jgi:hypothetical protein